MSLELLNYRRFRHVELEVPDGVVGLVGRNGAGKSTLIEAVGWALYGHDAARTTKDQIKRRGAAPGDDCRVVLRFVLDDHRVEVVRELQGASLSPAARVTVDGVAQVPGGAGSMDEATRYLTSLLHLDRESFFTSVVAQQKELNALSDMRPGERKETVLRMLGIDAVDEAIRLCREEKRAVRSALATLEESLEERPQVEARLQQAGEELEAARERAKEAGREAEAAETEAAELRERRDALRADRDRYEELRARRDRLRDQVATLASSLDERRREARELEAAREELQDLAPRDAAYREAREQAEALEAQREGHRRHQEIATSLQEARKRQEDLTTRLEALRKDITRGELARRMLQRVQEELESSREDLAGLRAKRSRLQGEMERQAEATEAAWNHRMELLDLGVGTPCPTCEQPLDARHLDQVVRAAEDEIEEHARAIASGARRDAELAKAASGARQGLAELQEREGELREKEADLARLEGNRDQLVRARNETAARVDELEAKLEEVPAVAYDPRTHEDVQARVRALEGDHERVVALEARLERQAEVQATLADLEGQLKERRGELDDAQGALDQLGFDPDVHAKVVEAFEAARERAADRDKARVAAGARVERAELVQQQAGEELDRLEEVARRADARRERLRYLDRLAGDRASGLLVDFKVHLISRIRPVLGHHATELFRDLTDGRYAALELDEDYELLVHDEGELFALNRFSGGETDLANLCLRLAVGELMAERSGETDLGFLALDEVFGSQDAIRRGNILQALAGLSGRFRQILVVTHVEEVRESVDHAFRVVEDDDGTSRVEAVAA